MQYVNNRCARKKDHIAKLIREKTFSSTESLVVAMTPGGGLDLLKNFNICNSYLWFSDISPKPTTCIL